MTLNLFRRSSLDFLGPSFLRPLVVVGARKMSHLFVGKSHTIAYAKYRPKPPQHLLDQVLKYVQEKLPAPLKNAVDIACGSGQSTLYLTPHFEHVLGVEVSANQLVEARKNAQDVSNVEFCEGVAEAIPVESNTTQLLTASQCIHWFDVEKFYLEAKRILVPNGVLAVYAHMMPVFKCGNSSIDQKLNDHLMQYHFGTMGKYWDPARMTLDERYNSICLPFQDVQRIEGIISTKTSSISDFRGYMTTWSPYQTYIKVNGKEATDQLVSQFIKRLMEILQSPKSEEETFVDLDLEYILLLGRKSGM